MNSTIDVFWLMFLVGSPYNQNPFADIAFALIDIIAGGDLAPFIKTMNDG